MEINPDVLAEAQSKGWDRKQWVSLIPYGLNQQHPNAYKDILAVPSRTATISAMPFASCATAVATAARWAPAACTTGP